MNPGDVIHISARNNAGHIIVYSNHVVTESNISTVTIDRPHPRGGSPVAIPLDRIIFSKVLSTVG